MDWQEPEFRHHGLHLRGQVRARTKERGAGGGVESAIQQPTRTRPGLATGIEGRVGEFRAGIRLFACLSL